MEAWKLEKAAKAAYEKYAEVTGREFHVNFEPWESKVDSVFGKLPWIEAVKAALFIAVEDNA